MARFFFKGSFLMDYYKQNLIIVRLIVVLPQLSNLKSFHTNTCNISQYPISSTLQIWPNRLRHPTLNNVRVSCINNIQFKIIEYVVQG